MRHLPVVLLLVGLGSLLGCPGIGRTPIFGSGNAAIDATLSQLDASLRTGVTNIDAAITSGVIPNPNAVVASSSTSLVVSGSLNDGSVTQVTIDVAALRSSDGANSVTTRVLETSTGFEFLRVTRAEVTPAIRFIVPFLGLEGLVNGQGKAYLVARVEYSYGTITTAFTNQSTSGATLVNFAGVSPVLSNASPTAVSYRGQDVLVEYTIANGVARITSMVAGSVLTASERSATTGVTLLDFDFTSTTIGGFLQTGNFIAAESVGPDFGFGGRVAANAPVTLDFRVNGGVPGRPTVTDIRQNISPEVIGATQQTISYAGNLSGLDLVGDGTIQTDRAIHMIADSREDPTMGTLTHSLDAALGRLEDLLYLTDHSRRDQVIYLYR